MLRTALCRIEGPTTGQPDLVRAHYHPGPLLRDIVGFLHLDEVYDTPPFLLRRSEIHIQGNKMRKTADRVLNLANKWRGELPGELIAEANAALQRVPWAAALYD